MAMAGPSVAHTALPMAPGRRPARGALTHMPPIGCGPGEAIADSYTRLAARVVETGRQPRARVTDLLIAATAHAHDAAIYTRNADDLAGLETSSRSTRFDPSPPSENLRNSRRPSDRICREQAHGRRSVVTWSTRSRGPHSRRPALEMLATVGVPGHSIFSVSDVPEPPTDWRYEELGRLGELERRMTAELTDTRDAIARLVGQMLHRRARPGTSHPPIRGQAWRHRGVDAASA